MAIPIIPPSMQSWGKSISNMLGDCCPRSEPVYLYGRPKLLNTYPPMRVLSNLHICPDGNVTDLSLCTHGSCNIFGCNCVYHF